MGLFDNLFGGTDYVEFDLFGKKVKLNIKVHGHLTRSFELYRSQKFNEAVAEINNAIKAQPNNPDFYYYKGFFLEDVPDYDNAVSAFTKSLEIDSSQFWVHFRLGICLQCLKKNNEALASFSKSFEGFFEISDPLVNYDLQKEAIYNNRAITYANLGKSQECIEDCSESIRLNPKYSNPYIVRGMEFYKLNKLSEAKSDIKIAATLGSQKAKSIYEKYFPSIEADIYDKIKAYADSEKTVTQNNGHKPRDFYRNDIIIYLQNNKLNQYSELLEYCKTFLSELWAACQRQGKQLDTTNKAYFTYELASSICNIFKSIDARKLFNDLYNN